MQIERNLVSIERLILLEGEREPSETDLQALYPRFRTLIGAIEGVESVRIGRNFRADSQRYTLGVAIRFSSRAALDAYGPHPNHVAATELMRPYMKNFVVVDFESAD